MQQNAIRYFKILQLIKTKPSLTTNPLQSTMLNEIWKWKVIPFTKKSEIEDMTNRQTMKL
jgi:hypothetical protein